MLTIIETDQFYRSVQDYWSDSEREAFAAHIASHPDAGDVVPGTGGVRKVRWTRQGMGNAVASA